MPNVTQNVRGDLLRLAGETGLKKQRIQTAARLSGLSFWRVFNIIYGKASRIGIEEAEKIRNALDRQGGLARSKTREDAIHAAFQFDAAADRLESIDPHFYRTSIDELRRASRACRGRDDSGGN